MTEHLSDRQLYAYLDEDLTEGGLRRLEAHLAGCHQCRQSLAAARSLFEQLESLPEVPLAADLSGRVVRVLRRQAGPRPGLRWLATLEAALAGGLVAVLAIGEVGAPVRSALRLAFTPWVGWPQATAEALLTALGEVGQLGGDLWWGWQARWMALTVAAGAGDGPWLLVLGLAVLLALLGNRLLLQPQLDRRGAASRPLMRGNGVNHG